jgi:hypothetical protein
MELITIYSREGIVFHTPRVVGGKGTIAGPKGQVDLFPFWMRSTGLRSRGFEIGSLRGVQNSEVSEVP